MLKKTGFHNAHLQLGGKMVDFFGWSLPVQYGGVKEEHLAVRSSGGVFDVSHMGEIFVEGPQALEALQYVTSNNVSKLEEGKIQYSLLPTETGCVVDDLLVHRLSGDRYLLVVNAANREKDYRWICDHTGEFDVRVEDRSDQYCQMALQGPRSPELMNHFIGDEEILELKYYTFCHGDFAGIPAMISRTGYTGEDGFEVYFQADEETAARIFLDVVDRGREYSFRPAGLGARDTLRLEPNMPLYGNDIDDRHTILEAGLKWALKLKKGRFIGREALLRQKEEGIPRKLVGFELRARGIPRHGYPVLVQGQPVAEVTSGTFSPTLKKAIGLTYLPRGNTRPGSTFEVEIRNKRVPAEVVKTPFYKRDK